MFSKERMILVPPIVEQMASELSKPGLHPNQRYNYVSRLEATKDFIEFILAADKKHTEFRLPKKSS